MLADNPVTQGELFYDSIEDALRATVEMMGGAKRVGTTLWPAKEAVAAQQQMLNCMDPGKPHKLALEELMLIARMAREREIHILGKFIAEALDYEFRVITPEDKAQKAAAQFADMRRQFMQMAPMLGLKVSE